MCAGVRFECLVTMVRNLAILAEQHARIILFVLLLTGHSDWLYFGRLSHGLNS